MIKLKNLIFEVSKADTIAQKHGHESLDKYLYHSGFEKLMKRLNIPGFKFRGLEMSGAFLYRDKNKNELFVSPWWGEGGEGGNGTGFMLVDSEGDIVKMVNLKTGKGAVSAITFNPQKDVKTVETLVRQFVQKYSKLLQ